MQKVLLTIKGTQTEGGADDYIEFVTEGRLYQNADGYLLEYDESELTGNHGTTTRLILEDGSVTLSRSGAIDTHMVFSQNSVYESKLSTPFGTMKMSIFAFRVESTVCEQSGSVNLEYRLNIDDSISLNKLDLSFKSMKDCIN
ncbi:MAG: DUF1934 domain-containing protein [Eubacteriales bacterium]|nr:DUF1934 domain-containing protein [Eubacteriales bacterium]